MVVKYFGQRKAGVASKNFNNVKADAPHRIRETDISTLPGF